METVNKKLCIISAPISTRSGYGSRSRDFVRGLIISKPEWDIKILSQKWGQTPMDALSVGKDDDLLSRVITERINTKPDIWIQITVPNEFQAIGRYNIGVTAGVETTIMPPSCMEGINRMNQVIVSSNFTKELIENTIFDKRDEKTQQIVGQLKCETPISVLFEGIDLTIYNEKAASEKRINDALSDVKESFAFLFVGHWLSGEFGHDRKNVSGLIYTFLEAFKNKQNPPALILKTSGGSVSIVDRVRLKQNIEIIKSQISSKRLPPIYLLHSDLSDSEMNALYNHPKVKAHLSFTKGEGFGRPLLEATISGKPMIVSGWSGHMDFINPEFVNVIDGKLENVHPSAANDFLMKEAQWFTIDYSKAGGVMRDMVDNYKLYLEKSRKHRKWSKDNFSFDKMVQKMSELFDETTMELEPKQVQLQLPKLKKVGEQTNEPPKLKLPKLKKVQ